jgi:hypothetical protein
MPLARRELRSYNPAMASWRCPHCDAPQPETARCWVCHRSTTSCSTCLHFRRAIAANIGYCALDKGRAPLTGAEERPCWERSTEGARSGTILGGPILGGPTAGGAISPSVGPRVGIWEEAQDDPAPAEPPALSLGMWAEPDVDREGDPDRQKHGSSIRARPWGPVPGHRDDPAIHRNGKWPRQS